MGVRVSRIVAYLTALVLLAFALRSPRRLGAWGGWVIMLAGGVLALLALLLVPDLGPVAELLTGPVATILVLVGWVVAAVLAVVDAVRRQNGSLARIGLGLVVLACAQLYRTAATGRVPATDLVFPALRLVGLVVLVAGLLQLVV